jgi:hypothetical protein
VPQLPNTAQHAHPSMRTVCRKGYWRLRALTRGKPTGVSHMECGQLSAADRKNGDVSPVPSAAPRTPSASSMPARPYTGSAATDRRPPCRRRARRVPMHRMGAARRLGSARDPWIPVVDACVIEKRVGSSNNHL